MEITYSRHARRRAKLYEIADTSIAKLLSHMSLPDGRHEIIREIAGFSHAIKIVISVERERATIVTVYPLKKGPEK